MRVKAGSIMMWRSCLLHGVAPNLSPSVRKHLYIAYTPRWVRPTAPDATMLLDPELLEGASPIRKQLLGGMGDGSHPLGDNAAINDGVSQHWFPTSEQKVPLKAWAEEHARKDEPMDWGAGGQGASWPPSFWRPTVGVDGGGSALNYLPKDSPAYELFSPGDFSQGYSNFQASNHLRKPASFVSCSVCGRAHSGGAGRGGAEPRDAAGVRAHPGLGRNLRPGARSFLFNLSSLHSFLLPWPLPLRSHGCLAGTCRGWPCAGGRGGAARRR